MPEAFVIGVLWFASSAGLSTYANTTFLTEFDSPLAHTVVRFACSALIGLLTTVLQSETPPSSELVRLMWGVRLPAALLLLANFLNSVALRQAGITLCYVCKSGIPVFTMCFMVLQGQRFSPIMYISLLPTVLGVALASASDSDFSLCGLVAALGSALAQTMLNITSKRRLQELRVTGRLGQFLMVSCCLVTALPLYLLQPAEVLGTDGHEIFSRAVHMPRAAAVLVLGGVAYHIEYMLNFMFMPFVSPLAFSITDIARRLTIIVAGAVFFHKALTVLNVLGILLALGGVLWYSYLSTVHGQMPPQLQQGLLSDKQRQSRRASATLV
mmetsp:Transcript_93844/g.265469  ORF Transcript_93844/g.265469 Transcript_93844/m.265469 type:complete len:327 (-) Transcript_93844:33-1013(-)